MIAPKLEKGRNKAERAPTTTPGCPSFISRQMRFFLPAEIPECQILGIKPTHFLNRLTQLVVSTISGSKIKHCRPNNIRFFTSSK